MCSIQEGTPRRQCEGCPSRNVSEHHPVHNHCPMSDRWGHKQKKKKPKMIRISFVNVNGIGAFKGHEKSKGVQNYIKQMEVDVMGIAETNVNWGKVRSKDSLWDRTKLWAEH